MNKIQEAYEMLKQAIQMEGFEPSITVWIHNHRNPHMTVEKAKEILDGYETKVDTDLFKSEDTHMIQYVDGAGGFRITADIQPKKNSNIWLFID